MNLFKGMRNALIIQILILAFSYLAFADTADKIKYVKVKPDGVTIEWDEVRLLNFTDTVKITVRHLGIDGKYVEEFSFFRINAIDDKNTPEDESTTEGRDLMNELINFNVLERVIKEELGITK